MTARSENTAKPSACPTPPERLPEIEVSLLTGGFDKPYASGLARALISKGVCLDVIGSDDVDGPEMHSTPGLTFLNLHNRKRKDSRSLKKAYGVLVYYARLLRYAACAKPRIFHILWNNRFQMLDRTLLMRYYKLLGKTIVVTAHNVNAGKRDSNDSWLNRVTLKTQYRLADHIFVHTDKMKNALAAEFGVNQQSLTIIPFGINNSVPDTELTPAHAKQRLGIRSGEKTVLFFGNIGPYKGLDILVAAFQALAARDAGFRLIIAGKLRGGCGTYWENIRRAIDGDASRHRIIRKIEYIPDHETELYFKAADVLALPYKHVSQSGVLLLGYNFGLPAIAADVGSFREDIIEGKTGFLCRSGDALELATAVERYFNSDLFKNLNNHRMEIKKYANARYSWDLVGEMTRAVYAGLLDSCRHPMVGIRSHSRIQHSRIDL